MSQALDYSRRAGKGVSLNLTAGQLDWIRQADHRALRTFLYYWVLL